jgi:SAM-dependent methyltransferase
MRGDVARLFDAMADDYDVLEPWYVHLYEVLHRLLLVALAPPAATGAGRALDAGCGTGLQTALLARLGYETHGVDIAAALLARARRRLPAVALARASIEALPYPDATFDVVTCCGSTLSLVEAPGPALRELARVLRPGGRLFLECEHRASLDLGWALASSLALDVLGYGLAPREAWRTVVGREPVSVPYPGYGRLRLFRRRELTRLLGEAGLATRRAWGIHVLTNLIPSTVLHRPRLPGPLALVYRGLAALDDALRAWPGHAGLANSLVVLADKPA